MPKRKGKIGESDRAPREGAADPISLETIGSRIAVLLDLFENRKSAAEVAGISDDQLTAYAKGRNAAPFPVLARLATAKGVRLEWIWSGNGPMRDDESGPGSDFVLIPRYRLEVSAGAGREAEDEPVSERLAFQKRWLSRELGVPARHLAVVTARGDSMEPRIRDGAVLLLDTSQTELHEDGVYVIRRDHHLQVKRLQRGAGDQVIIRSDNPAYAQVVIDERDSDGLAIVGRVLWAGGRL